MYEGCRPIFVAKFSAVIRFKCDFCHIESRSLSTPIIFASSAMLVFGYILSTGSMESRGTGNKFGSMDNKSFRFMVNATQSHTTCGIAP